MAGSMVRWPPEGNRTVFRATRDTWLSSVGEERDGSNGKEKRLKVKGNQEYALIDFDLSGLAGRIVTGALLHARSATPEKAPLLRLGVSSIAGAWVEGSSRRYRRQEGSSSFSQAAFGQRDWSYAGSTLMDVVFGRGHTTWRFADCSPPDGEGWQRCAVDPEVVAARAAGLSQGFCLYDEVGSEWDCRGGRFRHILLPNRFFFSRESGRSGPWMEVWTKGDDRTPPGRIDEIHTESAGLPGGEAVVSWPTPADEGGAGTLGFQVGYRTPDGDVPFPRYLIPMAGDSGETVRMHIRDLPFAAGEVVDITIRPVDSAGNVGPAVTRPVALSPGVEMPPMALPKKMLTEPSGGPLTVNSISVSVVDLLDKIDPERGRMIPEQSAGYRAGNHLFRPEDRTIRLHAGRNETVAFQVNLAGPSHPVRIEGGFPGHSRLGIGLHRFGYVEAEDGWRLPDPLLPWKPGDDVAEGENGPAAAAFRNRSLIGEVYVPHDEPPGRKRGRLLISSGGERLEIAVEMTVWNFTLPDRLSFVPEMNAYGTADPFRGYDHYRLAHLHRTCINRLPYNWGGVPAFSPKWDGGRFHWEAWDRRVGPLLDGSAFGDLPRKNEPVDVFYLPFNENWPVPLYDHYRPSYWADEAFDAAYAETLQKAMADFADHCGQKGWNRTVFQFYLNNKVTNRSRNDRSSAPWLFDEPVNTQDFWALRWYGRLWKEAVGRVAGDAKLWFRGDVSYSQFARNLLWGIMDVEYLGGIDRQKVRMKRDEQTICGRSRFAEYGGPNRIEQSNVQPVLWCLSAWSNGAMGVLPWQTMGTRRSWREADTNALFYPGENGPLPSVRLKAFTCGQQMVEYLTLLCRAHGLPRHAVADWLRSQLDLRSRVHKQQEADAGTAVFANVKPQDLWGIRMALGTLLSEAAPPYRRSLVERQPPSRRPEKLPKVGYAVPAPLVERRRPGCDDFRPR